MQDITPKIRRSAGIQARAFSSNCDMNQNYNSWSWLDPHIEDQSVRNDKKTHDPRICLTNWKICI